VCARMPEYEPHQVNLWAWIDPHREVADAPLLAPLQDPRASVPLHPWSPVSQRQYVVQAFADVSRHPR
jgi:hypothetical protein